MRAGERLSRSSAPLSAPGGAPPGAAPKPRRPSLVARAFRRTAGMLAGVVLLGAAGGGIVAWQAYEHFSADLPSLGTLQHYDPKVVSRIYASDSELMAEYGTERRIFVPIGAIPKQVQQAFISAEDRTFWTHHGVDPAAIVRAGLRDMQQWGSGRRPQGASTITQQLAKNMLVGNQLSLARKVKEAILAIRIDQVLSKERVLELYLNEIYLGQGSYGIAAAAQAYFNKPLDQLTLAEAALLGGLPKAPNAYNPFRFPDAARARRDFVLDRMREDGTITPEQAQVAKAQPVVPNGAYREPETVPDGKWFAEEVRRLLVQRYGIEAVNTGGLTVRTSLDPALQKAADRALRDGLMRYDHKFGGWRGPVTQLPAGGGLANTWATQLAAVPRPPGLLPEWRLGVVLDVAAAEARVGWLAVQPGQAAAQATPRTAPIQLSDLGWARPVHQDNLGPSPRRVGDVLHVGDVVMVEPVGSQRTAEPVGSQRTAEPPGAQRTAQAGRDRLLLRQVPKVEGALVAIEPATGRVLAMSGGWSFDLSQFNRATQAQRQPGSSFKPYVFLTGLEAGYSPSQKVLDAPMTINTASGPWRPNNFELNHFLGPVPLRIALERSINLATVRLAQKLGMDAVADTAAAFHVVDGMPKVLPASLGAVETTVLRQAAGYASFAAGGREVLPSFVDTIQDQHGGVIYQGSGLTCACGDPSQPPRIEDQRKQIADPQSVFQLVTMMQGVVQHGTGAAAGAGMGNRQIAGKTGTTQDYNDAWFVGFTPDLVTAVWIGNDDNTSLGDNQQGGRLAAPIWHDFMLEALRDRPNLKFLVPDGITLAQWSTGYGSRTDAFKPDQMPGASDGVIGSGGGPGDAGLSASSDNAAAGTGVDTGMGGLY
jgi:penicillin-binding protein 1A